MSITRFPGRDARNQKMHSDNIASLYIAVFQQAEYLRKLTLQFIRFGRTRLLLFVYSGTEYKYDMILITNIQRFSLLRGEEKEESIFHKKTNSRATNK